MCGILFFFGDGENLVLVRTGGPFNRGYWSQLGELRMLHYIEEQGKSLYFASHLKSEMTFLARCAVSACCPETLLHSEPAYKHCPEGTSSIYVLQTRSVSPIGWRLLS